MSPLDILKWLPLLINLLTEAPSLIAKIDDALKRDTALTPEEETARDAYFAQQRSMPWWQEQD